MEADFWHRRWTKNEIGFHEGRANSLLVKHLDALQLAQDSRLFLPLCGKTRDIAWLLEQGFQVVGAELSDIAITEMFTELSLTPSITKHAHYVHYCAHNIDIYVGNIFDLTPAILGDIDAVYDRAALIALPATMRKNYTQHLMHLSQCAQQLLICFEYDDSLSSGPPFSVDNAHIADYYGEHYVLTLLESLDLPKGFRASLDAKESIWHLLPKLP